MILLAILLLVAAEVKLDEKQQKADVDAQREQRRPLVAWQQQTNKKKQKKNKKKLAEGWRFFW